MVGLFDTSFYTVHPLKCSILSSEIRLITTSMTNWNSQTKISLFLSLAIFRNYQFFKTQVIEMIEVLFTVKKIAFDIPPTLRESLTVLKNWSKFLSRKISSAAVILMTE